jgi:hypothetical protein
MKKLLSVLLLGTLAQSANSWGPKEQGVVAGAAGLWAIQQLSKPHYQAVPQQVIQPVPVYVYPTQQQVFIVPPPPTYGAPSAVAPMVAYYCESARLYYPYVHSCNEGWKIFPTN